MTNGPIRRGIWRQFVLWTLTGALLFASAGFDRSAWAQSSEEPSLEDIKKSLDEIESTVDSEDITGETLAGFRDKLNSATDILRKKIDWLEPRAREAEDRLKELGPAPAKDAPPESAEIASQREELTSQFNDVDGELKQARVLTVRTDQLGDRVAQKRHALYANELFARSASILDPSFWGEVYRALPIELRSMEALLDTWSEQHTRPRWAAAALIIIVIIALAVALTRWWLPRIIGEPSNTRRPRLGPHCGCSPGSRSAHRSRPRGIAGPDHFRAADRAAGANCSGAGRRHGGRRIRPWRRARAACARAPATPAGAGRR